MGLEWIDHSDASLIVRLLLPGENGFHTGGPGEIPERTCDATAAVTGKILRMLAGEAVVFDLTLIHLDGCNPFQKKVLLAEYGIPRGRVSTYGRIARFIGCPGGARAVGNALATNPFPLIIPCHRAVRSDGRLGGFRGGIPMKRRLLGLEGVKVDGHDRVRTGEFFY